MNKPTTLYFEKRGCNNETLSDIKNHRIDIIERVPFFGGCENVFLEFTFCTIYKYRTTNKRTGAPLKKPIREIVNANGLHLDTEYEITNGCYRISTIEREVWETAPDYNTKSILEIVNKYSPTKYNKVVFVEDEARNIITKKGGYREKAILENDPVFSVHNTTWNDSHKCVKVYARRNNKLCESCEIDILNGTITG